MRVIEFPGFQQGFARLPQHLREKTWYQLHAFLEHIGSPIKPKSLRLKKLPHGNFEISITMDLRVLFQIHRGVLVLALLGDHEDVRRYLRR